MDDSTVRCYDKFADEYDKHQFGAVPEYRTVLRLAAEAFRRYVGKGRVLDLGCGTGNLSLSILKRSPDSRVVLVDGSRKMLNIALDKIKKEIGKDSVEEVVEVNLYDSAWDKKINGAFDAVVSTFVLEHLPGKVFQDVIKKIWGLLSEKGIFILLEVCDDRFGMVDWLIEDHEAQSAGFGETTHMMEELKTSERHYVYAKDLKTKWWEEAGFNNIHTVWQYLCLHLMAGTKNESFKFPSRKSNDVYGPYVEFGK